MTAAHFLAAAQASSAAAAALDELDDARRLAFEPQGSPALAQAARTMATTALRAWRDHRPAWEPGVAAPWAAWRVVDPGLVVELVAVGAEDAEDDHRWAQQLRALARRLEALAMGEADS